jgi:hypothetical protein
MSQRVRTPKAGLEVRSSKNNNKADGRNNNTTKSNAIAACQTMRLLLAPIG